MDENFKGSFFVTTPIYYVNDVPHIGHAYTTIISDALSRYKKMAGYDVFFLTGTDEHGQKVEKSAAEKGMKPIELADKVVVRFKDLWTALNIDYDYFIRTTEPHHEIGVQKLFKALREQGDIYKGTYQGFYCVSDEYYLPEDIALEDDGTKTCPDCGKKTILLKEESYFFKLSAYQDQLLEHYKNNPEFVRPKSRMNEVLSFVKGGLRDLSITRTTVKWGIPIPGDKEHTVYVWFDALHNYMTAIGFDWNLAMFAHYWPADVHFIGKDILRFHAVYWPAFLMASGFELPKCVYGHGWWLKDESKMSKSKGNVLDPHVILNAFGPDPLRYFLLREIPIGLDGNFSHEGFIHRINSDLANDLGNLVQRTLTMIQNYFNGKLSEMDAADKGDAILIAEFEKTKKKTQDYYETYAMNKALEEIWVFISFVNKYLADNEPWQLAKDETQKGRLARILYQAAASIRAIAIMIYPVMPDSAEKIWSFLGEKKSPAHERFDEFRFDALSLKQKINKPTPLFPRVDLKEFLAGEEKTSPVSIQKDKPAEKIKEDKMGHISFKEFKTMELRVAQILEAERVEGTDKLLKLKVDLGDEQRQLVAGVAQEYSPEELVGKKLGIIANLEPATIRGVESQGMILAAEVGGKAVIAFYPDDVPPGSKIV
ncbi:methionine--tRNA ligase [Acidobacteriota bacterium]